MPEQIENRMLIDSEWEYVELAQMRIPDNGASRLQRILDEIEYNNMNMEDEE